MSVMHGRKGGGALRVFFLMLTGRVFVVYMWIDLQLVI